MDKYEEKIPSKVFMTDMLERVKQATYTVMPGTTTTICQLEMVNGYNVYGMSACVNPNEYSKSLGEKYAFEDAVNKLWPLEGYLLAERRHQAGLV